MATATIKIFLVTGDPSGLRTAEIINWAGVAVVSPRTQFQEFLKREEMRRPGIYILVGLDPESGRDKAYIGEAEHLGKRLRGYRDRDDWSHAYAFAPKDENLTKAHAKFLEGRIIEEARRINRFAIDNSQSSGARLSESDRSDMEFFLDQVKRLLPVLGCNLLVPIVDSIGNATSNSADLICKIKGLAARGRRTSTGFVVYAKSQAVVALRDSIGSDDWVAKLRSKLIDEGKLRLESSKKDYRFSEDVEFASPSAAAAVICGGRMNGLTAWRDRMGRRLKTLEAAGNV